MSDLPSHHLMMISLHGYVSGRPELGRPDTGGQVVYVLKLSESLARLGYQVDILTRRFEEQPAVEPLGNGVRIVRVGAGGRDLIRKEWMVDVIPEWVANAEREIARFGYTFDLIDSHYWDAGLAGTALAGRLRIPHIHTPHSIGAWKRDTMDGDPAELDRQYNFVRRIRGERAIYRAADAVIATTPQQRDLLVTEEYGTDPARIAVMPPGYDETRFFPVSGATRTVLKRSLGIDGPLVLALGRVAANKGYDLLLRAMPVVVERIPGVRLLLAVGSTQPTPGEVAQVDELRELARELGIAGQVTFADHIPDDRLADTYRAADVFALSSRYEPFGMTAIEALACGTPVVVTTEGGLWQMLEWGTEALYADPRDASAYGHAIAAVLRYPAVAAQLARRGSDRARATFTWNGIAQQLLNVLSDMEAAPRPTRAVPAAEPRAVTRQPEAGWVPVASS